MTLTRLERKFLSRRACAWCDQALHRDGCGAIYEKCSTEVREKRRADCLATYKPRHTASTPEIESEIDRLGGLHG